MRRGAAKMHPFTTLGLVCHYPPASLLFSLIQHPSEETSVCLRAGS